MNRIWKAGIAAVLLYAVVFFCAALPVNAADTVRVVRISSEIDAAGTALVRRSLQAAEDAGNTAFIVEINTLGGEVDSALKIRDMLQQTNIPTIAYVTSRAWSAGALIALSCRHLVMAPGSSIGAAEPIPATEKNIAALKAEFSAAATATGKNPRLAEAMVDKTMGYYGYADEGQILALSDVQAKTVNLSDGTAASEEAVLGLYSLGDAVIVSDELEARDMFMGILQSRVVRVLLVALIFSALVVEIKMGGIGAGLGVAVLMGLLLLGGGDESWLDSLKLLALFVLGAVFIGIELVTPAVGVFGLAGVVMVFGSLFFMLGADVQAVYILAGGIAVAAVLFAVLGKRLPKSRFLAGVTLKDRSTRERGYSSQEDKSEYVGRRGRTITILRPSGTVRIGRERVDAVSHGDFIDKDTDIRVVQVEGTRVIVEPVIKE
ncbi:NfeD family protein [Anaeroglobus geminatus]|uniref:Nodulation efficiency protein D n=1 Tax=Anaeroglobus geminatus F0357 TaxID=861450 RepID=G9YKB6_9FIRM|nr:NfeD family protein [Anaeroglobus geminatus]EHM37587.1 nodulation efficiency protein D [Anaeroglobus geminatus F0357]